MKKIIINIVILTFFLFSTAFSESDDLGKNREWLADIKDMPSIEEIEKMSQHIDKIMERETDKTCDQINPRLRKMIFLHFAIYQYIVNKRGVYLNDKNIHRWAHTFAMLLKESSGDTTSITEMSGRSYSTYEAKSDLNRWRKITSLSKDGDIKLNYQTNFGLTQISVDRLFVAMQFSKNLAYLKGRDKTGLNTANGIRKLIWFYQDFAQGRITQSDKRVDPSKKDNPEDATKLTLGVSIALLLCGTDYMFSEGYHNKVSGVGSLADAMASIAYCKLGSDEKGYGLNEEEEKCFAKWVTLCPTLNFDIAMITPLKYFATRNAAPVCEKTFKALMNKKKHKNLNTDAYDNSQNTTPKEDHKFGYRIKKLLNLGPGLLRRLFSSPPTEQRVSI